MTVDDSKASLPQQVNECALCGCTSTLLDSHIVPAFLFRWLKKTGGPIRSAFSPNVRVQDGTTMKLLGACCEARLNSYETPFSSNIFYPFVDRTLVPLDYSKWLLKFCVSISWRVLLHAKLTNKLSKFPVEDLAAVDLALNRWKSFLLDEVANPGRHSLHLFPFIPIRHSAPHQVPVTFNRYLLRQIETGTVNTSHSAFSFAKIGPFVVLGFVRPPEKLWRETTVHVNGGLFPLRRYVVPNEVLALLVGSAQTAAQLRGKISDNQKAKIAESVKAALQSGSAPGWLEAYQYDQELFGF
jgi:hypothetical protein